MHAKLDKNGCQNRARSIFHMETILKDDLYGICMKKIVVQSAH